MTGRPIDLPGGVCLNCTGQYAHADSCPRRSGDLMTHHFGPNTLPMADPAPGQCAFCGWTDDHHPYCPTTTTTGEEPMDTDKIGMIEPRPPLRERDHILNTAKRLISGDRQNTYGEAIDDFTRTGKIWAAILGVEAVTAEQVALCMAALKMGRLCNTPNHNDSWVDACGYLALGGDIAATDGRHI